jgi:hypothetical protein
MGMEEKVKYAERPRPYVDKTMEQYFFGGTPAGYSVSPSYKVCRC